MITPDKREKCIVYPFYLKFYYVMLTDAAVFHKNSMRAVLLRLANVPKVLISIDLFLASECLHFSEVLLPVGMTAQGGTFQGLK